MSRPCVFVRAVSLDDNAEHMGVQRQPDEGRILACDFNGFRVPEMTKTRPVVILCRNKAHEALVAVVPLSSSMPRQIMPFHYEFPENPLPASAWPLLWAKCDMVVTVSIDRLRTYGLSKAQRRRNADLRVSDGDFKEIQQGVAIALGLAPDDAQRTGSKAL